MSSQASKADLHRILSGEKDLESNNGYAEESPRNMTDTAYFDHVGAHFGPRKDTCPIYPDCVDLHDNEAATQSDPTSCWLPRRQLRHGPERDLVHSPPTPTLTPTQKGPYTSPTEFRAFGRGCWAQEQDKRHGRTHESTPAQSREPSPSTTTGYTDQANDTFLYRDAIPEQSPDRDTPSHRSFASDENENHRGGMGPFPPQPYSVYNLYKTSDNTNTDWSPADVWQQERNQ